MPPKSRITRVTEMGARHGLGDPEVVAEGQLCWVGDVRGDGGRYVAG
ncbi:MAG: hypothetical protein GY850_00470 [bacterium]|nr:hypothetical protein [bacterium]